MRLKCAQVHHHSPAGTFTRVPGRCLRWSPTPPGPRWSPAIIKCCDKISGQRSFTAVQTLHTHTHLALGRVESWQMRWKWGWKENENEMNMKMAWKMLNQDTRRGTQKKRERENTNTNTPGPEPANPERAREKKSGGRRKRSKTRGEDRSAWTNLPRRNLSTPQHAQDPTYLRREAHMK